MKVVICSLLKFPEGDAGAIRQKKIAMMLKDIGHKVCVVGLGKYTGKKILQYEGIPYLSLRIFGEKKWSKIRSYLFYWIHLKKFLVAENPDIIIMDDMGLFCTIFLKKFCATRNIILIHDSVEWYSSEQFKYGKFSIRYLRKDILNRFLIDKHFRIIAISRYLYDYYSSKGIKCAYIPIVITEKDLCEEKHTSENKIAYTYAGQPGKKDFLDVIIHAFSLLSDKELEKIRINIVGCSEEQVLNSGIDKGYLEKLKNSIIFYGRVPHEQVIEILKKTDFTIMMRQSDQRYAKAGFPTKVVESLANSTPVICNISSDLGRFLKDGYNSLIVDNYDVDILKNVLRRSMQLTYEDRRIYCINARKTAEEKFLYNYYLDSIKKIIS